MDYSKIPEELKALKQWVCCWDNSKIPMKSFEKRAASSTAPDTWSTFDQAHAAVENGHYDQIGLVFADNGLVGIDIDDGFHDGLMSALCVDIVKHCQSYTEKSRSGRGVHILLRGNLPFTGRNNLNGVEIYRARRFFIMTGQQMIYPEIIENQAAIDYVVQKYFPDYERSERDGRPLVQKIYTPTHRKPDGSKVFVKPDYPDIISGGRNISLTSLAGMMHNTGYNKRQIYQELCRVNSKCCHPPLHERELELICDSITRYRR